MLNGPEEQRIERFRWVATHWSGGDAFDCRSSREAGRWTHAMQRLYHFLSRRHREKWPAMTSLQHYRAFPTFSMFFSMQEKENIR